MRELIKAAFPMFRCAEEEPLDTEVGGRRSTLKVDFLLPDLKVAIEVQGRQHAEYIKHFHGSRDGFEESQARDRAKQEGVEAAGYTLIAVDDVEVKTMTVAQLIRRVAKATKGK